MSAWYELNMNNSNKNHFNILDLPDETLFIIFKKLNMVDVFYSFLDVNRRFHRLTFDSLYVRDLDMSIILNFIHYHLSILTQKYFINI